MAPEIILENVSKHYGRVQALDGITLRIGTGMFGLLGRNGAGKTTLMRILATTLPQSGGRVTICGTPVEKAAAVRRLVGYLPQEFSIYPGMTVYQAMDYLGVLSGLTKAQRQARILPLLSRVNLESAAKMRTKALSGGMRRRLGIAQAILHNPQVLIVDEPTAGLDPEERVRFRELLCAIAEERIVLLSTHIVEDVEKTCQNLAVMNRGHLLYAGPLSGFVGQEDDLEAAYIRHMEGQSA